MTIITAGQKFTIDPELKNFIVEKVSSRLSPYGERIHTVHVTVTKEHVEFKADCDLTSDFGEFFSTSSLQDPESSVDQAVDRMLAELRKKHDIITQRKHPK